MSETIAPRALSQLDELESESIHILREVASAFERPVMLYSVGKDSSVMLRLARKAFYPEPIPFPLLHIDTAYKFPEMYAFRDQAAAEAGAELIVHRNEAALAEGADPYALGTSGCCALLKTRGLLDALSAGGYDAAFGGARRDEEKSRAKERVFSFRDRYGRWDPKNQRPELWNLYNTRLRPGENIRVFPLSNWTELDVWRYIARERIPVVPLYFARERAVAELDGRLIPVDSFPFPDRLPRAIRRLSCRFRSLGCMPCTGAFPSAARDIDAVLAEMLALRSSERADRLIDLSSDDAMERKKREGYF